MLYTQESLALWDLPILGLWESEGSVKSMGNVLTRVFLKSRRVDWDRVKRVPKLPGRSPFHRNRVYNSADLRPSLEHPTAAQLLACLSHLVQPVAHDGGSLAEEEPVAAGAMGPSSATPVAPLDLEAEGSGAATASGGLKTDAGHAWPDPWLHAVRTAASSGESWGVGIREPAICNA